MQVIFPIGTNQMLEWIWILILITLALAIAYFVLLLVLKNYKKKNNSSLSKQHEKIVVGQVAHVYTTIHPPEPGFIVLKEKREVSFYSAIADSELEEGTAVVIIDVANHKCKVKPLISRISS